MDMNYERIKQALEIGLVALGIEGVTVQTSQSEESVFLVDSKDFSQQPFAGISIGDVEKETFDWETRTRKIIYVSGYYVWCMDETAGSYDEPAMPYDEEIARVLIEKDAVIWLLTWLAEEKLESELGNIYQEEF